MQALSGSRQFGGAAALRCSRNAVTSFHGKHTVFSKILAVTLLDCIVTSVGPGFFFTVGNRLVTAITSVIGPDQLR
jgi:hypothetical protein